MSDRLANAMRRAREWFSYVGDTPEMIESWTADALLVPKTPFRKSLDELGAALAEVQTNPLDGSRLWPDSQKENA